MRKRKAAPQDKNQDALLGEIQRLRKQVHQLQLERDILTKANELIKKDLGVSFLKLKNREKTLIVDALKKKYPVACDYLGVHAEGLPVLQRQTHESGSLTAVSDVRSKQADEQHHDGAYVFQQLIE